jgi:GGDEF domain-containing protein
MKALEAENKWLREQLELYSKNYVTGLLGRHKFMQTLTWKFNHEKFYLTMYDVNGLHRINREDGYASGDCLLRRVAKCIQEHEETSNSFHIGGDDFFVISKTEPTIYECKETTSAYVYSGDYSTIEQMLNAVDKKVIELKDKLKRRRDD